MGATERHNLLCAGAVCNCILPESLKINAAGHDPASRAEDSERKMLTSSFSCFCSISLCQRHFSTSSPSLRSSANGTSWDTKQSNSTRLKKSWQLRSCVSYLTHEAQGSFFVSNLFYDLHQRRMKRYWLIRCFCILERRIQLCLNICTEIV